MATHRKIQQDLSNEFTVTASCPMSGPYDLSGVMVDVMLSDSNYAVPGYLPYLVFSWNQRYQFYTNPGDYLTAPYDTLLPPLFNGQHSIGYINNFTPSVPKLIFKQDVIDTFANNPNHPFRLALADNDVYNWKPTAPVHIVFCRADQEVNWHNALTLYNTFKANGATNVDTICVSETLPHYQCAQFAVLSMKGFFNNYKNLDSCSATDINDVEQNKFSIYPNPADEAVTIGYLEDNYFDAVSAVNAVGQSIDLPFTSSPYQTQVNVKQLAPGIYFLKAIVNGKNVSIGRILKM